MDVTKASTAGSDPPVEPSAAPRGTRLALVRNRLAAARRRLRRARDGDPPTVPWVAAPIPAGPDLDLIVMSARSPHATPPDGRGALAPDRDPSDTSEQGPADKAVLDGPAADAPVWVRRLDQRIPVMPTIGNVPVDHDGQADRRRHAPRRGR